MRTCKALIASSKLLRISSTFCTAACQAWQHVQVARTAETRKWYVRKRACEAFRCWPLACADATEASSMLVIRQHAACCAARVARPTSSFTASVVIVVVRWGRERWRRVIVRIFQALETCRRIWLVAATGAFARALRCLQQAFIALVEISLPKRALRGTDTGKEMSDKKPAQHERVHAQRKSKLTTQMLHCHTIMLDCTAGGANRPAHNIACSRCPQMSCAHSQSTDPPKAVMHKYCMWRLQPHLISIQSMQEQGLAPSMSTGSSCCPKPEVKPAIQQQEEERVRKHVPRACG
eukprot:350842-Chlamydomonas_euryale.AAC.2